MPAAPRLPEPFAMARAIPPRLDRIATGRLPWLLVLLLLLPVCALADAGCAFEPEAYEVLDADGSVARTSTGQLTLPPRLRPTTSTVRFELPPTASQCWLLIDRVSLYGLTVNVEGLTPVAFDFFRPQANDRFAGSGYALPLPPHGESRSVLLTVTQLGVMSTRAMRVDIDTLLANERRISALHTLTLLAPLLMAVLVGLFWMRLRDRALAAYMGLLASLVLITASLDGTLYFFALSAPLAAMRSMAHILLLSLFGLAIAMFYREFLGPLDRSGQRTFNVLAGVFALTGVSSLLGIPVYSAIIQHLTTFSLMVAVPMLLWQGIRSYRAGRPLAGYFLVGWSIPLLVIPLRILAEYGVIEWSFPIRYAPRFAFMLEAAVFALGLADRMLRVRIERDRAEQERLRSERALAGYRQLAEADALTGLASRRALESALREWDIAATPGSALFIDIDLFKQLNDVHGHAVGDEVLRAVAAALRDRLPAGSHIARYGGEELVALLPGMEVTAAFERAERVRSEVASTIRAPDGTPVTVSAGVAQRAAQEPMAATLSRADAAMYRAKAAGRNRVVLG